ncbi:hypothetical protein ACI797_14735 [Geodermatophilus sp. SYSU D00691]
MFMSADAASAFLIGRLAMEGRQPQAVLKAAPPGPWRGLVGVLVFAVADGRLWLVQPQLLGEPSVASVPLAEVGEVAVRSGRRVLVELRLGERVQRYTALDGAEAAEAFAAAARGAG